MRWPNRGSLQSVPLPGSSTGCSSTAWRMCRARWRRRIGPSGIPGGRSLITITLSAADAATHVTENPLMPTAFRDQEVAITLVLLAVLGGIFLKGFKEAIGIAVLIVGAYLLLNIVVVAAGFYEMAMQPQIIGNWQSSLLSNYNNNPLLMIGTSLLVFPRLALGLSGFETGVGLMPLVRGDPDYNPERPAGRIHNTKKMLTVA